MCWSAEVSIISFVVGMAASLYLIWRNKEGDRLFGIFFGWTALMQLIEFLFWIDQKCGKLNIYSGRIAAYLNLTQALMAGFVALVYVYGYGHKSPVPKNFLIGLLIGYTALLVYWTFDKKFYKNTICVKPCGKGCDGHGLQWPWSQKSVSGLYIWVGYFVVFFISVFSMFYWKYGKILLAMMIISLAISLTIYPLRKAIGSWWCLGVMAFPVMKIFM